MKTILVMFEVADENYDEVVESIQDEMENPLVTELKITAYETYTEGELIPDIMKRGDED